jgi:hypothetical protein
MVTLEKLREEQTLLAQQIETCIATEEKIGLDDLLHLLGEVNMKIVEESVQLQNPGKVRKTLHLV